MKAQTIPFLVKARAFDVHCFYDLSVAPTRGPPDSFAHVEVHPGALPVPLLPVRHVPVASRLRELFVPHLKGLMRYRKDVVAAMGRVKVTHRCFNSQENHHRLALESTHSEPFRDSRT